MSNIQTHDAQGKPLYELAPTPGMTVSARKAELDACQKFVAVRNLTYLIYKKVVNGVEVPLMTYSETLTSRDLVKRNILEYELANGLIVDDGFAAQILAGQPADAAAAVAVQPQMAPVAPQQGEQQTMTAPAPFNPAQFAPQAPAQTQPAPMAPPQAMPPQAPPPAAPQAQAPVPTLPQPGQAPADQPPAAPAGRRRRGAGASVAPPPAAPPAAPAATVPQAAPAPAAFAPPPAAGFAPPPQAAPQTFAPQAAPPAPAAPVAPQQQQLAVDFTPVVQRLDAIGKLVDEMSKKTSDVDSRVDRALAAANEATKLAAECLAVLHHMYLVNPQLAPGAANAKSLPDFQGFLAQFRGPIGNPK